MSIATVTKVTDGDTFQSSIHDRYIRLSNVNAPEKRQPGYQEAKTHLKKLIELKKVNIDRVAIDGYNRVVAKVYFQDGKSVNQAMRDFLKKL